MNKTTRYQLTNLSRRISEDDLRVYFSNSGKVEKTTLVRNNLTGISEGLGIISFKQLSHDINSLHSKQHFLKGSHFFSHLLQKKNISNKCGEKEVETGKTKSKDNIQYFSLSRPTPEITENVLKNHFSKYGQVEDVTIHRNPTGVAEFGLIVLKNLFEKTLKIETNQINGNSHIPTPIEVTQTDLDKLKLITILKNSKAGENEILSHSALKSKGFSLIYSVNDRVPRTTNNFHCVQRRFAKKNKRFFKFLGYCYKTGVEENNKQHSYYPKQVEDHHVIRREGLTKLQRFIDTYLVGCSRSK